MPKRLLVLGAGGPFREGFFRAAARRDVQTILVDDNPYNRYDRLADVSVICAPDSPDLPDALGSIVDGVDGVTSLSDRAASLVDRISQQYGKPGPGARAALASHDKAALRRFTNDSLNPVPWTLVASAADLFGLRDTHAGPFVLKPIDGSGSFGVAVAQDMDEAVACLEYVLARSRRRLAIAEAFVPGPEYSFEVTVRGGELAWFSVTEKATSGSTFVERQHVVERDQRPHAAGGARPFVVEVLTALGVEDAVLHVEARNGQGGWHLIEAATRPAGGMIAEVTRAVTGVDVYDQQISIALGEELPAAGIPDCEVAGVRFVLGTGVVQDMRSLLPLCRDLSSIAHASPLLPVGFQLHEVDANWWRAGYVLARGGHRKTVLDQLRLAEGRLTRAMGLQDVTLRSHA